MIPAGKRKIFIYSATFIALILNIPKLLALRKSGILAHFWKFDGLEFSIQTFLNFLFCLFIFLYSNNRFDTLFAKDHSKEKWKYVSVNFFCLAGFSAIGLFSDQLFTPGILPGGGVIVRLICSAVLIYIELRVLYLSDESGRKNLENEQLRNENLRAGIALLKAQLNPHFLFNSLSSLSAVVRENPVQAQVYISHLSKLFRYSLHNVQNNLVTLKEELTAVTSYTSLMKMRYEKGLDVLTDIEEKYYAMLLPHMSLQPLLENAVKHNIVSASKPLHISIKCTDEYVMVSNNLQPVLLTEISTGIGLANLNERYKLILKKEIEIIKTDNSFIVKLPFNT